MKKLFFTAIAMIAFSAVSFAGNVEVKKEEPKKVVVADKALSSDCVMAINYYLGCNYDLHDACVHASHSGCCN